METVLIDVSLQLFINENSDSSTVISPNEKSRMAKLWVKSTLAIFQRPAISGLTKKQAQKFKVGYSDAIVPAVLYLLQSSVTVLIINNLTHVQSLLRKLGERPQPEYAQMTFLLFCRDIFLAQNPECKFPASVYNLRDVNPDAFDKDKRNILSPDPSLFPDELPSSRLMTLVFAPTFLMPGGEIEQSIQGPIFPHLLPKNDKVEKEVEKFGLNSEDLFKNKNHKLLLRPITSYMSVSCIRNLILTNVLLIGRHDVLDVRDCKFLEVISLTDCVISFFRYNPLSIYLQVLKFIRTRVRKEMKG